jgi:leucyl aminopeptidase
LSVFPHARLRSFVLRKLCDFALLVVYGCWFMLGVFMVLQNISFVENLADGCSVCVVIYSDGELSSNAKKLDDSKLGGEIAKNAKKLAFSGKLFESTSFVSSVDTVGKVILIGIGESGRKFSNFELEKLGASIYSACSRVESCVVAINPDDVQSDAESSQLLIAFGALLKSWDFDKYKPTKNEKIKLSHLQFLAHDIDASEADFLKFRNLADAIFLTRLVVSEPANVIYPASLAEIAQKELLPLGVDVEILNKNDMKVIGMNALLGVAQGSEREPKLVVLSWKGGAESDSPIAFVGKGVTFDSGGINLKPENGMHEMRQDMAGSGTVLGLMKAVAANKIPVNVVGVMALVENMPSGTAQRPGDIVKSMSGLTIEVLNTDAEGRLVLADAIWYTQDRFSPKAIIDLATLTGAIVVALGHEFAGLFTNNEVIAAAIKKSAEITGENVWLMPMTDHFDKGIESDIADIQNIAKSNVRGGSITAAHFIRRFTNKKPWAHLDIAGVESTTFDDMFICSKGATGFGVHLLYNFLCGAKDLTI